MRKRKLVSRPKAAFLWHYRLIQIDQLCMKIEGGILRVIDQCEVHHIRVDNIKPRAKICNASIPHCVGEKPLSPVFNLCDKMG